MSNVIELPVVERPKKARRLHDQRSRAGLGLGPRPRTENIRRITKRSLEDGRVHLRVVDDLDVERPRKRGDCDAVERPCPFVGCRHNLFLDVDEGNGSIKYNFPDREPDEVDPERSCALDIAALGGGTLEDIGELANVTRERIRQIEAKALTRLRKRSKRKDTAERALLEYCDAPDEATAGKVGHGSESVFAPTEAPEVVNDQDREDDASPTRVSFFAEGESADEEVCNAVWQLFAKDSNSRGFDCRSRQQIAASRVLARKRAAKADVPDPPTPPTESDMASKKRGELLAIVLENYRAFEKHHGKPPTASELFAELGEDVAKSVQNIRMSLRRLEAKGEIGGAKRSDPAEPATKKRAATSAPKKSEPRRAAPASKAHAHRRVDLSVAEKRPRSSNPVVAAMEERRDELADQVAALTVAIDVMREGARA